MKGRRTPHDLPVGIVVMVAFAIVFAALAGLFKLALAIVLVAFAAGAILRAVRSSSR